MQALHDATRLHFASDNYAGAHPAVLDAMVKANTGHVPAYGADPYSTALAATVRQHFGPEAEAFPVFTGSAANVVALSALLPRFGAVVCAEQSHINNDEAGAPEQLAGLKLLQVPSVDAKLTPDALDAAAVHLGDVHKAQPLAVSLTQATELGTVYTTAELTALTDKAHALGMLVHVDGARLANAAAHLGTSLAELTTACGVDAVSFGGTKNGGVAAEAIVLPRPEVAPGIENLRKSHAQLASKMRFSSAQLLALLEDELWLKNANHANAMASRLRGRLEDWLGTAGAGMPLEFTQPTESNAVFARLPRAAADRVRETFRFYDWDAKRGEVRWMCSWDTSPETVDAFAAEVIAAFTDSDATID